MKKTISYILITILIIYLALQIVPYPNNNFDNKFIATDKPLIIAHGGAKLMNPENTWMAYDFAMSQNVDVLEIDVHLTKDDILVTVHNDTIDEYTNHTGKVEDYTLEELQQMNFGYHFVDLDGNTPYKDAEVTKELTPAILEEMFQKYGKDVLYIIEVKNVEELGEKATLELLRLVKKYNLEEYVCLASFDEDVMEFINEHKDPNIISSMDFDTAAEFVIGNYAGFGFFQDFESNGMQLPMSMYNIPLASKYLVYKIHHNNMFVHYWTVNTKEEMIKCIKNNADGIITDRLDLLQEVYAEYYK